MNGYSHWTPAEWLIVIAGFCSQLTTLAVAIIHAWQGKDLARQVADNHTETVSLIAKGQSS